jgi:hypothetical protein
MSGHSLVAGNTPVSPPRLKRLANLLRKEKPDLTHRDALNILALQHGWANYTAYEKAWKADRASVRRAPGFAVTLSAHWAGTRTWGVEVAQVTLSAPWWTFLTLEQRRSVVAVSRFRIDGKDRTKLVSSSNFDCVENAQHYAGKAARAFAFVDALRVVPAKPRAAYEWLGVDFSERRCPALDHELEWHDPSTGEYFLTNEPYLDELSRKTQAQQTWLQAQGLQELTLPVLSIHNPPQSALQLITRADSPALAARLTERREHLRKALAAVDVPFRPGPH